MGGAESKDVRSEEKSEAAAKEREITKLELMEERLAFFEDRLLQLHLHNISRKQLLRLHPNYIFSSSSTFPFTMGGAESKDERSEEESEAAPAKRREIRELELMEERLALIRELLLRRHHNLSRKHLLQRHHDLSSSSTIPFTMGGGGSQDERAEEKSEAAAALRREIMESMEERLVFIEWNLWSHEPDPNISSFLIIPFTMGGVEEDEWTEEKSEAAAAKRREIRELESMEERLAFMRHHLWHHFRDHHHDLSREHLRHHEPGPNFFRSEEEREAAAAKEREIREEKLKEEYMAFKRHRLSSLEPDPNISRAEEELHLCRAEEKREAAKEREIREKKLMEEYMAFRRHHLSSLGPDPNLSSERSFGSSPEEERAGSPASSCVSLKRWDSKGLLIEF